jgi:hypothetical protein
MVTIPATTRIALPVPGSLTPPCLTAVTRMVLTFRGQRGSLGLRPGPTHEAAAVSSITAAALPADSAVRGAVA